MNFDSVVSSDLPNASTIANADQRQPMPSTSRDSSAHDNLTSRDSSTHRIDSSDLEPLLGTRDGQRTRNRRDKRSSRSKDLPSTDENDDLVMDTVRANLMKQRQNLELHEEMLRLQAEKLKIGIAKEKVEYEKSQLELGTARQLAAIEIERKKQLADLDIAIKRAQLERESKQN